MAASGARSSLDTAGLFCRTRPQESSRRPRRDDRAWRRRSLSIVLVGAGIAIYHNGLDGTHVLDDEMTIAEAASRFPRGDSGWLRRIPKPRDLGFLSLAVNRDLDPFGRRGAHAFNQTVHVLGALVLFGLARRTLARCDDFREDPRRSDWIAFSIALIWMVHPLQTAAVTYTAQRFESLMGLCYLLCVYCLCRSCGSHRRRWWYGGTILAFVAGAAAKEIIVTAPLVLLAYDRIYLSGGWRRAFRDRWALYAALAAPTTWLAWYLGRNYLTPGVMKMTGVSHPWISPWMYLRSQAAVVLHYLRVALWPDALCLDYCWPVASETEAVVPGLVVLALVATSLALLWRRPQVGFLLGTFFVILAPTSSFVPLADLAFDHRMYLPLAPLVALVVLACRQANQSVGRVLRWEPSAETRLLVVEAILVAIPLGWRTVLRNEDYRTEVALYRADVAACPQSRRAQNNLGVALLHSGFVDEGLDRVQRGYELACAVVRDGREIDWYFRSLQLNLESVGRSNELKERLASARERNPNSPHIRSMLGFELMTRGEYPDAIRELQAALKVAPTSGVARRELVRAEIVTGRPGDAVRELKRGVALQPNDVIGLDQLSWVLATHPDPHVRCGAEAVRISEKVCLERGSQMTQSWSALAAAYAEVGRFPDAVEAVLHAIDLATRRKQRQGVDVFVEQLKRCQSARPERMNFQAMSKVEWPALAPWENRTN